MNLKSKTSRKQIRLVPFGAEKRRVSNKSFCHLESRRSPRKNAAAIASSFARRDRAPGGIQASRFSPRESHGRGSTCPSTSVKQGVSLLKTGMLCAQNAGIASRWPGQQSRGRHHPDRLRITPVIGGFVEEADVNGSGLSLGFVTPNVFRLSVCRLSVWLLFLFCLRSACPEKSPTLW